MSPESGPAETQASVEDIVADRVTMVRIGMAAVFFACAVFGTMRFVTLRTTGMATPYWGNAAGAVMIALLYVWWRAAPLRRSSAGVHGTAFVATVALLVPAAYGMTSSKWWLSLVGFSVLLMGRRKEAIVWTAVTVALIPLTALFEARIVVPNAAGEGPVERAMAGLFYVLILSGITFAFRRAAQARARQLAETAASLDRANRVRSQFLAHMSHDLRTPLHGVIALTDLARTGEASDAVHEQVSVAQQSAQTLLGLLNNILDVTRAEAGGLDLDRRPFALHGTLGQLLRPFVAQAEARGIVLEARAEPGIIELRIGDPSRFGQIVLNLLSNALKFTERGKVTVSLRRGEGGPEAVEIAVSDTGRGIDSARIAHVFEPFQQASAADAQVQGGAGLGLAIVRELSRSMGGGVRVQSRPGEGSTFTVSLRLPPADESSVAGPEELLDAGTHGASTRRRLRSLRVLACEDNTVNQQAIRAMLDRLGHESVLATNGVDAWELLRSDRFDVLLTDVEMPRMGGVELTRLLREDEKKRGVRRMPVIAATVHVGEAERHRLLEADMDEHLPKPFTLNDLAEVLDRMTSTSDPSLRSLPKAPAASPLEAREPRAFDPALVIDFVDVPGENRPLILELADRFHAQSVRTAEELVALGERGDRAASAKLVHALVSSAAALGLTKVVALARVLERADHPPSADDLMHLEKECGEGLAELRSYVGGRRK